MTCYWTGSACLCCCSIFHTLTLHRTTEYNFSTLLGASQFYWLLFKTSINIFLPMLTHCFRHFEELFCS